MLSALSKVSGCSRIVTGWARGRFLVTTTANSKDASDPLYFSRENPNSITKENIIKS